MKGDILVLPPAIFPLNSESLEGVRETTNPLGSFSIASKHKVGYLLPFFLQNPEIRDDHFCTNVVISEEATDKVSHGPRVHSSLIGMHSNNTHVFASCSLGPDSADIPSCKAQPSNRRPVTLSSSEFMRGWIAGYDTADLAAKAFGVDIGEAYAIPIKKAIANISQVDKARHHGEKRIESSEDDRAKQLSPDGTDSPDSPLSITPDELDAIREEAEELKIITRRIEEILNIVRRKGT